MTVYSLVSLYFGMHSIKLYNHYIKLYNIFKCLVCKK